MNKNKISTSRRPSATLENGFIISKPSTINTFDETKRISQQLPENSLTLHQYGKTLNVPDPNNALHALPMATSTAPLVPHRPAIMSTPKSSMITIKNPSTSIGLSPTESRPLLLVTQDNDQNQPQTITVPNGRRLPLNAGRMTTMMSPKQRQQPTIPINNNHHQMINEVTTQKAGAKKYTTTRPRTALFFSTTRTRKKQRKKHLIFLINNFRRS